ncbi:hypothetical protein O9992_15295 [Vibrio lentus]|nr:hypothetical protein [Vibrio lentus]
MASLIGIPLQLLQLKWRNTATNVLIAKGNGLGRSTCTLIIGSWCKFA